MRFETYLSGFLAILGHRGSQFIGSGSGWRFLVLFSGLKQGFFGMFGFKKFAYFGFDIVTIRCGFRLGNLVSSKSNCPVDCWLYDGHSGCNHKMKKKSEIVHQGFELDFEY